MQPCPPVRIVRRSCPHILHLLHITAFIHNKLAKLADMPIPASIGKMRFIYVSCLIYLAVDADMPAVRQAKVIEIIKKKL
jgi:hypothetical protein